MARMLGKVLPRGLLMGDRKCHCDDCSGPHRSVKVQRRMERQQWQRESEQELRGD